MSRARRLPSGEVTRDESEYLEAWHLFAAIAEEVFDGYKLSSFDPTVVLTDFKTWRSVTLGVPEVRALAAGLEAIKQRDGGK